MGKIHHLKNEYLPEQKLQSTTWLQLTASWADTFKEAALFGTTWIKWESEGTNCTVPSQHQAQEGHGQALTWCEFPGTCACLLLLPGSLRTFLSHPLPEVFCLVYSNPVGGRSAVVTHWPYSCWPTTQPCFQYGDFLPSLDLLTTLHWLPRKCS